MQQYRTLDALVQARLRGWPQQPPGLGRTDRKPQAWVRGRPSEIMGFYQPFLKLPGSNRLRTLPDGLWLCFGGTPVEIFVDIFAIEACGSLPNLLDKRSRFAPSTHSMMAVCSLPWLLAAVSEDDPTPRWKATGVLRREPTLQLVVPVRDIRVMYALKQRHYNGFVSCHLPHPHEYFVPMDALVAEDAAEDPAMRALVARASTTANFLEVPGLEVKAPRASGLPGRTNSSRPAALHP